MYDNKKILALIPARGGSKGIKDKNIIDLCGEPLISYTIKAALSSSYIDDVIITTDSGKIAEVAKNYGAQVPFMRPEALATDTSKTIDSVLHAIETLKDMGREYDVLILLQPTAPLRDSTDIDNSIESFFVSVAKSLVSVSQVNDTPILIRQFESDGKLTKLLDLPSTVRRQDMQPFYVVNGCIYINYISELNSKTSFNDNEYGFTMSPSHSVDIDEPADLVLAAFYLTQNSNN